MSLSYRLTMKRGKRQVFIGAFPSRSRASAIAGNLEWDGSWKPIIELKEDRPFPTCPPVNFNPRPAPAKAHERRSKQLSIFRTSIQLDIFTSTVQP